LFDAASDVMVLGVVTLLAVLEEDSGVLVIRNLIFSALEFKDHGELVSRLHILGNLVAEGHTVLDGIA